MKFLFLIVATLFILNSRINADDAGEEYRDLDNTDDETYDEFVRTIGFEHSVPVDDDERRCTIINLENKRQYITAMVPETNRETLHHMVLIGCKLHPKIREENRQSDGSWRCDHKGDEQCGTPDDGTEGQKAFFTWALGADGFKFDKGIGFRVGPDADINFLVMQVHYAHPLTDDHPDVSKLHITMTNHNLKKQAAIYLLGGSGYVPPGVEEFHMDTACEINLPYKIVPVGYRTHTHHLGDVISGYAVIPREGRKDDWKELGRMSPRQAQQINPVTTKNLLLYPDDILAARCTMNSLHRTKRTKMGHTNADEMCLFYMIYYTRYEPKIEDSECWKTAQEWNWEENLRDLGIKTPPPANNHDLSGVILKDYKMELEREELEHLHFPGVYNYHEGPEPGTKQEKTEEEEHNTPRGLGGHRRH